jgi:peroxiredoxin Q/BCP
MIAMIAGLVGWLSGGKAGALEVGDTAPGFELPGSDGNTYRLADYRDDKAVVLAWFPKAFTPGCTTECTVFAREGEKLKEFDIAYFTASCDKPEKNAKFAEKVGADYPILSDPEGDVARAYGVIDALRPVPRRWTFIIGEDGTILHIDKNVSTKTHAADVAAKLEELGIEKRAEKKD